ncbi:MAG TPA: fatty acid desaturase [Thiobacillaceae bacterium]|nr:fatty acid desaturase [Thiobacillaceae bacterium]HNA80920.1 fatty acid desaturase [Thiobacillaceae bacterium]HNF88197.1 fatty acid desaturase [Thiobacillaceae bacterium]HNH88396.1 fatty acid desaturase [Thiobacillaceae bacterium]HNI07442.1 fatty acid desaturase [Thiobacillaceae bacterium]
MSLPSPMDLRALRPRHDLAWLHVAVNLLQVGGGLALSASSHPTAYVVGQVILALGFSQALILVHEAGHRTLFRGRLLNDIVGTAAGFLALVPYASWRPIHARHHRYTGWQDLDATTESLVPRQVSAWERALIDLAWRSWLPLFSIIYRIQNYWRVERIRPFLASRVRPTRLQWAARIQLLAYVLLVAWFGVPQSLALVGPGLLLALAFQDILLLSQHTYMPTHLSHGQDVRLFPPQEQGRFTRSLCLPAWLSWLILHFDAHELHHLYPAVPGYLLHRIPYAPPNEVHWLAWLREVKAMSGCTFLFAGPHPEPEP